MSRPHNVSTMFETTGSLPQHVLHGALGTLLIGTWINTMLLTLEITQICRYFASNPLFRFRSTGRTGVTERGRRLDPTWIRIMVSWMFVLDVVASGVGCAMVYTYTVTGWGNTARLLSNDWMMVFFGIASALGTLTMHLFLISRYYTLSHATGICSILCLLALTACGLYVFISISLVTLFRHLGDRHKMETVIIAWAVDTASTDWLIAGTLMWFLFKIRTTVDDSHGSIRMLTRLIRISSLSGAAPAFLALLTFIAYLSSKDTNLGFMFSLSIGRAATLSVLYNLNSRSELAQHTQSVSVGATVIYLDTTVEPRQMFGGGVNSWSTTSSRKDGRLHAL